MSKEKGQDPAYPPSYPGYPTNPGYPAQYSAPSTGAPPPATGAPPPYSTTMYSQGQSQVPVSMYPHQQQYTFAQAQGPHLHHSQLPGPPMGAPPTAYAYQPPQQNPGYPVQPGGVQTGYPVQATAQFDSGARFDGIAGQSIPPPPPGIAPNAAQMAAAQGGQVFATQKKANWFSGGKGGGVSFW